MKRDSGAKEKAKQKKCSAEDKNSVERIIKRGDKH